MTTRRHQSRSLVKWVGTTLTATILIGWVCTVPILAGYSYEFCFINRSFFFGLHDGRLFWVQFARPSDSDLVECVSRWNAPSIHDRNFSAFGMMMPSLNPPGDQFRLLVVPLWTLLLAIGTPTLLLWYLDRNRFPHGHCRSCNYNLTGNTSGICPECGSLVKTNSTEA